MFTKLAQRANTGGEDLQGSIACAKPKFLSSFDLNFTQWPGYVQ